MKFVLITREEIPEEALREHTITLMREALLELGGCPWALARAMQGVGQVKETVDTSDTGLAFFTLQDGPGLRRLEEQCRGDLMRELPGCTNQDLRSIVLDVTEFPDL